MHFLQNRAVYLLTRVDEVIAPEGGPASASVLVAMAGSPIPSPEALTGLRADLYHFAFELREEDGAYRITGRLLAPRLPRRLPLNPGPRNPPRCTR